MLRAEIGVLGACAIAAACGCGASPPTTGPAPSAAPPIVDASVTSVDDAGDAAAVAVDEGGVTCGRDYAPPGASARGHCTIDRVAAGTVARLERERALGAITVSVRTYPIELGLAVLPQIPWLEELGVIACADRSRDPVNVDLTPVAKLGIKVTPPATTSSAPLA